MDLSSLFKKMPKQLVEQNLEDSREEDDESREDGATWVASGFAATESARISSQEAAKKFNVPKQYNRDTRKILDSGKAKLAAKKALFQDSKLVIDPYTGDTLVLTKREAKMLYGDNWTKHLAESDHIRPIAKVHEEVQASPQRMWLTADDLQGAINSDENISVTSRKFNNAKRMRTNPEYVSDEKYLAKKGVKVTEEGKRIAIQDDSAAKRAISKKLRTDTFKNIVTTGHEAGVQGAQYAGVTSLTMSGILNIVDVINGKKDAGEAIEDTIVAGGKAAVTGYVMSGGLTVASHSLSESSSKFIRGLANSNIPGKIITAIMITGDTLKRYGDGEITTQECLIELGGKGLNVATTGYSMAVGQALIPIPIVGGAVGALVGSILTGQLYDDLINELQTREMEHQERLRIIAQCREAAEQARAFRAELENYLQNYFWEYQNCFDEALSSIRFSFELGDADGIISGANQITRKLGGRVYYDTVDEFRDFLMDDSTDIL